LACWPIGPVLYQLRFFCRIAMTSRRVLKAAQAIREVVGMSILTDLRDPRIQNVTVTRVEVSADMRLAKVHVSVMGDEPQQKLSIHGLQNAAGFLQQKVAKRIDTRYTPKLNFVLDKGAKHSMEVTRILGELQEERVANSAQLETDADSQTAGLETPEDHSAESEDSQANPDAT
jgi:ribosome-binding factor A